jgi:plastocyanin
MIWLWRICFRRWGTHAQVTNLRHKRLAATAMMSLWLCAAGNAVTVSGTVQLRESRIASVARGKDYSGVVISLQPVNAPASVASGKHVTMLQKDKMFTPHILPLMAGTTVDFPNGDPIFHNAFSSYSGQIFDIGLYPPGTSRSVRFQRPGIVRVFCNIHASMSAIILVLSTPYFAVTPHDGSFHMEVPSGSYDLAVFHERATEPSLQSLSSRILVTSEALRLPPIAVSEAGYLMAPHKNKYGKDYDPPPDDKSLYPATHP